MYFFCSGLLTFDGGGAVVTPPDGGGAVVTPPDGGGAVVTPYPFKTYSAIPAATEALRELTCPLCGMAAT